MDSYHHKPKKSSKPLILGLVAIIVTLFASYQLYNLREDSGRLVTKAGPTRHSL
ncbi:Cu/Zn superoxide dismutase [Coprinopsis cinerea okayama7|uniref:Cu/Zn superoxide dismutase n=1 Tax=Coprinopsis cinerea (strain Okayama-7 / 130 / ATCC MYA-4618 / FGSC 9003) TaxID=240176 RepID=A8NRB6_COPC7|nr:Cu/Zn superoxide dismutase [Coprinopsis cinerea okayama7\|eukprot:XP_001835744.2 Cu/Zn superoxide dismutase [Coprinopsis cinerea okayama7\